MACRSRRDRRQSLGGEGKSRFATQDADVLDNAKECISGDLWGAIEHQDPVPKNMYSCSYRKGRHAAAAAAAMALLMKAVVLRPHVHAVIIMAAGIAAVGNIEWTATIMISAGSSRFARPLE